MNNVKRRLYEDLSWLWPMWGDPETEYADYCQFVISKMLQSARIELHTILNVGCGGGKNLYTLKKHFKCTGLDLSRDMLSLAKELNPECTFVQADMRDFELEQEFDAIFIDDAVCYMTSRADLAKLFTQVYKHLKPGGVMLVTPDSTAETFIQNQTQTFHSMPCKIYPDTSVVYIQNEYRADTSAETYEITFVYLIRKNGVLTIETDRHQGGLFSLTVWRDLLSKTGFAVQEETYSAEEQQYRSFVCTKAAEISRNL